MAGIYSFEVKLKDGVSGPAASAKQELSSLRDKMGALGTKILENRFVMVQLDQQLRLGVQSFRALREPTDLQTRAFLNSQRALKDERQGIQLLNRELAIQKGEMMTHAMAIRKMLFEMGEGGLTDAVRAAFKGIGVAVHSVLSTVVALYAGMRALEGAFGFVRRVGEFAATAVEAREAATALFDAMGDGLSTGREVIGMMDRLERLTGMTRAQMVPLAREFESMGIVAVPNLREALVAASSATRLVGESGGAAFTNMMARIQEAKEGAGGLLKLRTAGNPFRQMGVDIDDVGAKMGITGQQLGAMLKAGTADAQRFGDALQVAIIDKGRGPMERFAVSFTAIAGRMREYAGRLFENINLEPMLGQLSDFVELFSQAKVSGQALQWAITEMANTMLGGGGAIHSLKDAFIQFEIAALKAYIAIKTTPFDEVFDRMVERIGMAVGEKLPGLLLDGVVKGITLAGNAIQAFTIDLPWMIVKGITIGMAAAAEGLETAMGNLALRAIVKFRSVMGIHSPAAAMMPDGANIVRGIAKGAEQEGERGTVSDAITRAAYRPEAYRQTTNTSNQTSNSTAVHNDIRPEFHFHGSVDKDNVRELVEEGMAVIMEKLALTQGGLA